MAEKIDNTGNAVIDNIKLKQQTSHPSSPASGYELLYIMSGTANGGLFVKDSAGRQIGPFLTGTSGGSGLTLQYPPLKPVSPTYDFDGAALDGAFSAHSSQGSFATTDCITQYPVGFPGSSIAMQFSGQMGGLYVAHANTDFDFQVGGLQKHGAIDGNAAFMMGIAALDSSGNGVGVLGYTDGNLYIATIASWQYSTNSDVFTGYGFTSRLTSNPYWFRLKRVSGTWTGYASLSGRAWDKVFSTRADSVTVDRLFFGILYTTAQTYNGILTADYFHVDV